MTELGFDEDSFAGDYSGHGGRGSAVSTPLHPSAKRSLDDDDDDGTPASSRPRAKQAKRDSSLTRAVGQQRLILRTKMDHTPDASPAPSGSNHPALGRFMPDPSLSQPSGSRRSRPLTQHQLAVEQNRRQRIDYLLAKRKSNAYRVVRNKRESEIPFSRCARLLQGVPDGYDTEDEESSWGKSGLVPNPEVEDDFGECSSFFLSVVRKASRRLDRWDYEGANGPKKDRKKEREERHRAKAAMEADARAPGSRSRPRPSRSGAAAKRKSTGPAATGDASKKSTTSSRSKPSRSRPSGSRAGAGPSGMGTPSWDAEHAAAADDDIEGELDDIDRELLGEGSGDEDDGGAARRRTGVGIEVSYMGEGLDGDSTDDQEDEDDDVDENSSTFDGPNGYARPASSSPAPQGTTAQRRGEGDGDEVMAD